MTKSIVEIKSHAGVCTFYLIEDADKANEGYRVVSDVTPWPDYGTDVYKDKWGAPWKAPVLNCEARNLVGIMDKWA